MKHYGPPSLLIAGICFVLCAEPSLGSAMGKVAGTVIDRETGEPLPAVEIVLQDALSVTTDTEGDYFIVGVPAGHYVLTAHLDGYIPVKAKTAVTPGLTTRLDIQLLRRSDSDMDTICIENGMPREENVTSLVLRARDVRRRSLEEIVADQPGIIETGSRLHRNLHLRGGYADYVTYFLDGRRIYDPILIDSDVIDYAHLTKGRFAPEYGDAPSGVVDIVTKGAKTGYAGKLEYTTDRLPVWSYDFGHDGLNLTLGGPVPGSENFSFFMSGDLVYTGEHELSWGETEGYYESLLEKGSLTPLPHNNLRQKSGLAKLSWTPSSRLDIVLHACGANTKYHRYSHSYSYGDWLREQPLHDMRTSQVDISITHRLSPRTSYRVGVSNFNSRLNSAAQDGKHFNDWRTTSDQLAWLAYARDWRQGWYDEAFRTWDLPPEIRQRYETHGYTDPEEMAWMYYYEFQEARGHLDAETGEWMWDGASPTDKLRNAWRALNDRYHQVNTWQFVVDENGDTLDLYYHQFDLDQYLDDVRRYSEGDTTVTPSDFESSGNMYRIRYCSMWYPGDSYFKYYFPASWYDSDLTRYGVDFSLTSQIHSNHEMKAGIDLRKHHLAVTDVYFVNENPYVTTSDVSPFTASAYVQDKIEYGRLTAVTGLRYDYVQSAWDPSVNSSYVWGVSQMSTKPSHRWSPRISMSIAPSENFLMNWSYGHFYPVTPFLNQTERIILYDFGLKYTIAPVLTVAINTHGKDETSETGPPISWVSPGGTEYVVFYEKHESNSHGVDLIVRTSPSPHLSAAVGYFYLGSRGSTTSRAYYYHNPIPSHSSSQTAPLEVNGIHSLKIDMNLSSPRTFGPRLGPWQPLSNMGLNACHTLQSGRLYTPTDARGNPMGSNSERMPSTQWTDLSISKTFSVGGIKWGLFMDIFNLFDVENILDVHTHTGEPDDDGRLPEWDPAAYSSYENYGYESPEEWYQDQVQMWRLYTKDPTNYGTPRTIRVGMFAEL